MSGFRDRQVAILLAVLSGALFALAGRLRFKRAMLSGDEPHYLVFNRALEKYHSLDIVAVYDNRDYLTFYPGTLQAHVSPGPDGPLPLHGFGGPLLWHVPYLIWGYGAVLAFMAAVSVLIVVNVYYFVRERGIDRPYAGATTALFVVGTPIYLYSSMVFIEPIAALAILYAVRVVLRTDANAVRLTLAAAGLGVIPWVHGRFAIVALALGAALAWRVWRDLPRRGLWTLSPLVLLLVGLEVYNAIVWHSLSPAPGNANYGGTGFEIPTYRAILGVFLDRSYGLLAYFPLLVLAIPGVFLAPRVAWRRVHLVLALAIVPYLLAVVTWSVWWGGYTPPARFLAAVTPLLAGYVALCLQRIHHVLALAAAVLAALYSLILTGIGDVVPPLRWNSELPGWTRGQAMVRLGDALSFPFAGAVPSSFLPHQGLSYVRATVVVAVVATGLWFWGRVASRDVPQPDVVDAPARAE